LDVVAFITQLPLQIFPLQGWWTPNFEIPTQLRVMNEDTTKSLIFMFFQRDHELHSLVVGQGGTMLTKRFQKLLIGFPTDTKSAAFWTPLQAGY